MINDKVKKFVFAGGGTGGHLYPAIAIGQRLLELNPDIEIHFVGTEKGLENRVIPELGYPLHRIAVRGFSRNNMFANVIIGFRLLISLLQCLKILSTLKPNAVIGTGGYVSGPMLFMATLLRVPTLIQEQNSYPGITTRLLAKRVNQVHLSFQESFKYFKKTSNLKLTGNPVRKFDLSINQETARTFFGQNPERVTVMVFGGSQGAMAINNAFAENIKRLIDDTEAQFIWITGKHSFKMAKSVAVDFKARIYVTDYLKNMNMAYQASDLAVSRAGAIALSELALCGLPSILIPYPYAAADHQTFNAITFEKAGAAIVLTEQKLETNINLLADTIINLIKDTEKRDEMGKAAKQASFPLAVDTLANSAMNIFKKEYRQSYGFFIPRQKNIIF